MSTPVYGSRAGLETRYGRENIIQWADKGNNRDPSIIDSVIETALLAADELIDITLREKGYTLPLSKSYQVLAKIAHQLAASDLYNARGIQDVDDEGNPINKLRGEQKDAETMLKKIVSGMIRLERPPEQSSVNVPTVVKVATSYDEA